MKVKELVIAALLLLSAVTAISYLIRRGKETAEQKPAAQHPDTTLITANWHCTQISVQETPGKKTQSAVGGKGKFWPTGSVLRVGFIGGTATQIAAVKQYAPEWTQYANLRFDFPTTGPYEIRISFSAVGGAWSYVGTDAKNISQASATMNLGWISRDVISHEFGHALGLFHEHQNPQGGICWNEANVIRDLSGPPNNWTEDMIRYNVLRRFNTADVLTTAWDKTSVMHYSIPASWTCNNVAIPGGSVISSGDKEFIRAAYPGAQPPTDAVTITGANADLIVSLLNARQSEADTTAARIRRSIVQIKSILKR
jgi:hypothetical protein